MPFSGGLDSAERPGSVVARVNRLRTIKGSIICLLHQSSFTIITGKKIDAACNGNKMFVVEV